MRKGPHTSPLQPSVVLHPDAASQIHPKHILETDGVSCAKKRATHKYLNSKEIPLCL